MEIVSEPNFNLIRCGIDECLVYNEKVERNELINLNYIFRIKRSEEKYTGGKYDQPKIWFFHNIVNPAERSYDFFVWYYPNSEDGFTMRNNDYDKICGLCKINPLPNTKSQNQK